MTMSVTKPEARDLTARARIRDAALHLFTEQGVERTTIRDIAREAGVSSGLVQHHFGTKEALRSACDDYALTQLLRVKEELVLDKKLDNPAFLAEAHPGILGIYRYLARSMIDGSPAAAAMFEHTVYATEAWLATHHPGLVSDEHGYATVLVAMEIGMLAMHRQVSDALGVDVLGPTGHLRLSRAKVVFYSTPLLDAALAQQALRSIDALLGRDDAGTRSPRGASPDVSHDPRRTA